MFNDSHPLALIGAASGWDKFAIVPEKDMREHAQNRVDVDEVFPGQTGHLHDFTEPFVFKLLEGKVPPTFAHIIFLELSLLQGV